MKHLLLPFVGLALLVAGCAQEMPQEANMAPPTVTVAPLLERAVTDYQDFTGRAAAVESVKVRARVWGHLQEIKFKEGAEVKKGETLFVIDRRPYQAALDRADADVGQGEARVKRLDSDFARITNLLTSKAASREDYEKVAGDLSEARATLRSSQAARAVAKLNLDYTEVRAPIDGRIGRAMVTVGNLVESGELGGTLLTTLVSLDPMYVYFDVDDQTYTRIGPLVRADAAPPVLVGLPAEIAYSLKGTIDFVDNQVDSGTATMKMRANLKNNHRRLTPGLFVRVRVPIGEEHPALLISDRAIDTDQGQKVVYVVNKDNVVEKRGVKLGRLHDGLREIVEGAKAGERLVVDGLQRVRDGIRVTPKDEGEKDKRPK